MGSQRQGEPTFGGNFARDVWILGSRLLNHGIVGMITAAGVATLLFGEMHAE
jgi:hypothetical protein